MIVIGDFNINIVEANVIINNDYLDMLSEFGFKI